MKLFNKIFALGVIVMLFTSINVTAQCKKYTKKNCLPSLAPFLHNGQLTSAYMMPGDSADVMMTFNAGKEYRLLICSQEMIGKVQFIVLKKKRKEIYKSDPEDANPFWDFKMETTQQFIIQIYVPAKEKTNQKTEMIPQGCVALLVGFKK
jgi:hypothetical protein